MIYNNILETIGNTPVVRLNRTGPDHVEMYVKVESFNPMASVKDRLAFAIINDATQKGALQPGQTVIEATSPQLNAWKSKVTLWMALPSAPRYRMAAPGSQLDSTRVP